MESDSYTRLIKARTGLILKHPFFATLALRLDLKEDSSCETAWTDGKVLAYNPEYIKALSGEQLIGLMAHIVMHPACGHHLRRQKRNPIFWNQACDYAINWLLLDAGLTLPDGYLFIEAFRGMSAEDVYARLFESDTAVNAPKKPAADPGKSGEVRDAPLQSDESDLGAEGTDWQTALLEAAYSAKDMGKLPDGITRLINNQLYPQLGWQELLARFIEKTVRFDYSWTTPNRRYLHQGYYFPSLTTDDLSEIAIAVDTSGSVSQRELEQFASEISAIMAQYPVTIYLFYCDDKIRSYQIIDRSELPLELNPVGGGGTDYRPVFSKIEDEGIEPACLIYLTDLECKHYPSKEPYYPVLWVQSGSKNRKPPFGEHLKLQQESKDEDRVAHRKEAGELPPHAQLYHFPGGT